LAGLVNFVASKGDLFAVKGGNHRLVQSAFQQAQTNYNHSCASKTKSDNNKVIHSQTEVKTVVSDFESNGMELFDTNGKLLDTYDIVILATPLQFSGISFLTKGSLFDNNVLAQMTLNGMVDSEDSNANDHGHRAAFGGELPDSAVRKYSQVVTTIVSNATFNKTHFAIDDNLTTPKSILFTENGRNETSISSIGCITPKVFKIFSSNELSQETISTIFGPNVKVEYVKNWGNKNGGATPDFNGGGDSSRATQFLIYDGGHGTNSLDEEGSALYYVNSMESAVAAIEISAIGMW
jgi:prenylcysteine oxidase/farnesylcysteine lyase